MGELIHGRDEVLETPRILESEPVLERWKDRLLTWTRVFTDHQSRPPGLAVIRVGSDPASVLYVRRKKKMTETLGFFFEEHVLSSRITPRELSQKIASLNNSHLIDGIILQLPLPGDHDPSPYLAMIDPVKDVDGLHPLNRGLLYSQNALGFVPCTPWGCLELLRHYGYTFEGKSAVVVGRSILVGRPLAALLIRENATVTLAHSHTKDLASVTSQADFLFVAAGQKLLIEPKHVKRGAVVLDIGIHRIDSGLVGDVDYAELIDSDVLRGGAISPVPGGVGPLTVLGLMHNTLLAAFQRCAISFPVS